MPAPIYTAENCKPAYQLDWVYGLFWRKPPGELEWFEELRQLTEPDGIRLLQHTFEEPNVSKLLVSTKPEVSPLKIAQRVKGRLQHLIRERLPDAFKRNCADDSISKHQASATILDQETIRCLSNRRDFSPKETGCPARLGYLFQLLGQSV